MLSKEFKEYEFSENYSDITCNIFLYLRKINSLRNLTISEQAKVMKVSKLSASNMVYKGAEKLAESKGFLEGRKVCLFKLTHEGKR